MTDRHIVKRVVRTTRVSAEEAQRLNEIRRQAMEVSRLWNRRPEFQPGFGPHVARKS